MFLYLAIFLLTSCSSFHAHNMPSSQLFSDKELASETKIRKTSWQTKVNIPRHKGKIHWYNKINPIWWFGNIDDPVPPKEYCPNNKCRRFLYSLRNPFHNFTFYVIGIADREFRIEGKDVKNVFRPDDGLNFTVSHCGPFLLPFVSFKKEHFKFYIGWRPDGNFGFKFNPHGD